MKQEKNNEIDLLLRSLARGKRGESPDIGRVSGRDDGAPSDHLDADELSCFAEGVLPAAARARYASHLADCGSCRSSVVSLMQASGVAVSSRTAEPQTGIGFWQFVAAIFAAPVLRYAVPAIAFTAIIAISFVALRQQRRTDLVAKNEPNNATASAPLERQQTPSSATVPSIPGQTNTQRNDEVRPGAKPVRARGETEDEKSGFSQPPAPTPAATGVADTSLKDSAPSKQGYVGGISRPAAEAAPPPPPPKKAINGADKLDSVQKEEVSKREAQELPLEAEKNQPRDGDGRHGPSRSNNASNNAGNSASLSAARRRDGSMNERAEPKAKSSKDDDEVETRTVSGKRFRHQGSIWVDTAYDSSRGTTNVQRGSERFRALVADEPGIRTIAAKLDGVVIVVWNGRAYRIQ